MKTCPCGIQIYLSTSIKVEKKMFNLIFFFFFFFFFFFAQNIECGEAVLTSIHNL